MFKNSNRLIPLLILFVGLFIAPVAVLALAPGENDEGSLPPTAPSLVDYRLTPLFKVVPVPKSRKKTPAVNPSILDSPAYAPVIHDTSIPPIVNGLAPLIINLPTVQKVVFLGIDDGAFKQPFEINLLKRNHVKASLFLSNLFIKNEPDFFAGFIPNGSLVENHTVNHRMLSRLTYLEQKREICDEADLQQQQFGRRPVLFRPPGGDYNKNTQRAAAACGMKAVVLWISKANGGSMQYQVGTRLQPGDIVLMHFRPEFAKDFQAFLEAEKIAGLHTELLEDWLPATQ